MVLRWTKKPRKPQFRQVWEAHNVHMDRGIAEGRPPTTNALRIQLRDAKMWRRETELLQQTGQSRSRCPCTLCLFGRPLLRTTHAKHLRDYGRHPLRRLQPQVHSDIISHFQMSSRHGLLSWNYANAKIFGSGAILLAIGIG